MEVSDLSDFEVFYMDMLYSPQALYMLGETWVLQLVNAHIILRAMQAHNIILERSCSGCKPILPITVHIKIYIINSKSGDECLIDEGLHEFNRMDNWNTIGLYRQTMIYETDRIKIAMKKVDTSEIETASEEEHSTSENDSAEKICTSLQPTTIPQRRCIPSCESLSNELANLLKSGEMSDITLHIGTQTIHAHKCILSARSEVFQTMLKSGTNTVTIKDFEYDAVDLFVQFLYTGKLPVVTVTQARDLYKLANVYSVDELNRVCSAFMKTNLSNDNVTCNTQTRGQSDGIDDRHAD